MEEEKLKASLDDETKRLIAEREVARALSPDEAAGYHNRRHHLGVGENFVRRATFCSFAASNIQR